MLSRSFVIIEFVIRLVVGGCQPILNLIRVVVSQPDVLYLVLVHVLSLGLSEIIGVVESAVLNRGVQIIFRLVQLGIVTQPIVNLLLPVGLSRAFLLLKDTFNIVYPKHNTILDLFLEVVFTPNG